MYVLFFTSLSYHHDFCVFLLESNKNSVKAYSYSSLKLGNKNLLVQFFDTIWSNNESCQACKTSSSDGQCPLWPSCNTRNRTNSIVDDESKKSNVKVCSKHSFKSCN